MNTEHHHDNLDDLKKAAQKIISKWYLLVLSLLIALVSAYLVNRYTSRVYIVSTSVLIKETKDNITSASELLYGDEVWRISGNLSNESILLKSYSMVEATLKDLDLNVSYYTDGNFKNSERYKDSPIVLTLDTTSTIYPYSLLFKCEFGSDPNHYTLTCLDDNKYYEQLVNKGSFEFGKMVDLSGWKFRIDKVDPATDRDQMLFRINNLYSLTNSYRAKLEINPVERESSILEISLKGTKPEKEVDVLNKLVEKYIENRLNQKNSNAIKTIQFINDQLTQIVDSLAMIETNLEYFKRENATIDLSNQNSSLYQSITELDNQNAELILKDKYIDYLKDYVEFGNFDEQIVVPASVGISDPLLTDFIKSLVSLQVEIKLLGENNNVENPLIKAKVEEIQQLRFNILENIQNLKTANQIAIQDLENRTSKAMASLQSLPGLERQFIDIQRRYNLSESLYLFLMEKRAEAGIAKSSNTSDIELVDPAMITYPPIRPQGRKNYIVAVFLGIFFPITLIFLVGFFDNRIRSRDDLYRLTNLPFLGIIGHSRIKSELVISEKPKSAVAESFRTIRSNLRYMSENGKQNKTYLITSSISGEGKTFCANNLALILSMSREKTILISADMRRPNSYDDFRINGNKGLSNYLAGIASIEEVVRKTGFDDLYIITSGDVPPNPSELLLGDKMNILIKELQKEFDYILIDTPPIGILSDGMELMKFADVNIFMVRQGYSLKSYLTNINEMYANEKIRDMAILFNDVSMQQMNYGYRYYGYGSYAGYGSSVGYYFEDEKEKSWWRKLLNKNSNGKS